jgi:hypothetical protein
MEFIGVSTDSQHSSQQQGLALSLESNLKRKKDLLLLKLWLWIFRRIQRSILDLRFDIKSRFPLISTPNKRHTINLDAGFIDGPLRAGMTIAFEPIASIGGQGFYLEDMFLITKNGAELLTPGVPYSADEIETAMR